MLSSTPSDLDRSLPESERHSTASGAQMLAQNADPTVASVTKARLHLPYLDGIRALMALYVVHNHLLAAVGVPHTGFGWRPREIVQMFYQGHYAVSVFIVLSGYCLMLPVLRDNGTLRGGMIPFFKRRARRILPPYYAALVMAALILAVGWIFFKHPATEIVSPQGWALHLLLLHNLSWNDIYDYNGTLWSIATEWQIYFVFPYLFLPIWKRFGDAVLVVVSILLAAILVLPFPSIAKGCPWFVILFAFGMVAAKWSLAPAAWMKRIPWVWLGIALTLGMYLVIRLVPGFDWFTIYAVKGQVGWYQLSDIMFGAATFCFLLHGTWATREARPSKFVKVLSWRPLVFIGSFSYSLYLIHMPIQDIIINRVETLDLPRAVTYIGMTLLYMPLITLLAYGFYQLFEKPFIGAAKPKNKPTSA
ncbi:acyltransferase [bacterium]|nr:MAG: acyltransferase [bacterium]